MSEKKTKSDEIEKLKGQIQKTIFFENLSINNIEISTDFEQITWEDYDAGKHNHLFSAEDSVITIESFLSKVKQISFNNKYALWIIKKYLGGGIQRCEDLGRVETALSYFHRYKHRLEEKDRNIMNIKSLVELENLVEPFAELDKQKELEKLQKEKIYSETKFLYDGPEGKIVIPLTKEASIFWGQGTRWCTASTDYHNYFEHYNKQGSLYIFITPEKDEQGREIKYQFHFQSQQYMDIHDHRINKPEILKKFFINIPQSQKLHMFSVEKINLNWLEPDDFSEDDLINIIVARPEEMNNILERVDRFDNEFLEKIYNKNKCWLPYFPASFIDEEKVKHNYFNDLFVTNKSLAKNSNEYVLYETIYNFLRKDISPLFNKIDDKHFVKNFIVDQLWDGDERSHLFLGNDVLNKNCLFLRNYDFYNFAKILVDNYEYGHIYVLGLMKLGDLNISNRNHVSLLSEVLGKVWKDFDFKDKVFVFNDENMSKKTKIAGIDVQLKDIYKKLKNTCGNHFYQNENYGEIIIEPDTCKFALEKYGKNLSSFAHKLGAGNQLLIELGKSAVKSENFHIFDLPHDLLYVNYSCTNGINGINGTMNAEICLKSISKYENFRNFRAFDPFEDSDGSHFSIVNDKRGKYKKYLQINPMIVVLFEIHDLGFYKKIVEEAISYIELTKDPNNEFITELNIFLEKIKIFKHFTDMIPEEEGRRVFVEHNMFALKDYPRNKNGLNVFSEEIENEFLEWKDNKFDIVENLLKKF